MEKLNFQNPNQKQNPNFKEKKEKTKTRVRSGVILGVAVALAVLILAGLASWLFFVFLPKMPIKPEAMTKLFSADQLAQYFDYTDAEKDLHDSYVKFGQDKNFDIKIETEAETFTMYVFPKGLYFDTKIYTEKIKEKAGKSFNEKQPSLLLNVVVSDSLCQTVEADPLKKPRITTVKLLPEKKFLDDLMIYDFKKYDALLGEKENLSILNLEDNKEFPPEFELRLANEDLHTFSRIFWQSSDPTVVLVYPDGKLFPISSGEAEVRAIACGKEMAKIKIDVPEEYTQGSKIADFNPNGKLDTKFLQGLAKSKTSLIAASEIPNGKYINEVTIKPSLESLWQEAPKLVPDPILFPIDPIHIYYGNSPIQGRLEFFMSNNGGKTWTEGDKKIDNAVTNLKSLPEIKFNFKTEGQDLRLAVLFQSDFDQSYFRPAKAEEEKPTAIAKSYTGPINLKENDDYKQERSFHFQELKKGNDQTAAILPGPSPVLTGFEIKTTYADFEKPQAMPSICQILPSRCERIPFERLPKIIFPEGISFEPVLWHRGHSRVVLKWKFTGGVENNIAPSEIEFKYGKNEKDLLLGAKVYQDKSDSEYPYYVVLKGLSGGEYSDKNEAGFFAGRFKYFYQIKAKNKSSKAADFKTLNRLQTIGYYYDLILDRQYTSGEKGSLSAFENLENEWQGKKIKDLENGGISFWYKPKEQESLTLLGIKFTMLNDRKYQEFDKNLEKTKEGKSIKAAAEVLYREVHDRIYDDDLGKFFDEKGIEYWVSRTDPKIVGKDVIDIFGVKFAISVSREYQEELFGGVGVAVAKPELAYQIVLKRGADKAGLENLKGKYQLAKEMRKELALSKEYEGRIAEIEKMRGRKAAIEELYETLYARAADSQGRDYWDKTGMPLLQIRDKFFESKEFLEALKD